jgi:kynurenine formamidase
MQIHDFTLALSEQTPVFPGEAKPIIKQSATVAENGYNALRYQFGTHFGTHIDAPLHMLENGKSLSDYPASKFVGEAVVLDVRGMSSIDHDLEGVKEGDIVIFVTGHIQNLMADDYFSRFPEISSALAQKLVDKKVSIVGLDSFSPDGAPYDIHKLFFNNDILILENLNLPASFVGKKLTLVIAPLNIKGADGAPCRVFGWEL